MHEEPSAPSEPPDPGLERLLAEGLAELGSPAEAAAPLARLAELLDRWAQRINLTGHRGPEAIARRLVLDAAALERALPEADSLVDLGAGAGFPGLPLAVLRPGCRVTLVESRERRIHFQRAAIRTLALGPGARVTARRGRAEALEPEGHAVAVAQAMGPPERVAHWLRPWVAPGGFVAIPGSERPPEVGALPGLDAPRVLEYRVPLGGPRRTLWLARRRD